MRVTVTIDAADTYDALLAAQRSAREFGGTVVSVDESATNIPPSAGQQPFREWVAVIEVPNEGEHRHAKEDG